MMSVSSPTKLQTPCGVCLASLGGHACSDCWAREVGWRLLSSMKLLSSSASYAPDTIPHMAQNNEECVCVRENVCVLYVSRLKAKGTWGQT